MVDINVKKNAPELALEDFEEMKKYAPQELVQKWAVLFKGEKFSQEEKVWLNLRYMRAFRFRHMLEFDHPNRVISL